MASDTYDLTIDQGADWAWTIRWKVGSTQRSAAPKDITGYFARMQIRRTYSSENPMLSLTSQPVITERMTYGALAAANIEYITLSLIPSPPVNEVVGAITIDGDSGTFSVRITPEQASSLEPGKSVYDFEVVDTDGKITKLARGTVTVIPEVTR